jgi:trk system potassium uptake protein TrkH
MIVTALLGTVLLSFPFVTRSGQRTPLIDALFTAISAASVSGLSVVDTLEHWNRLGQFFLIALVQIGGLGFSVGAGILLQMLRRGSGAYSLRDEMLMKDGSPSLTLQEAVTLAGQIVRFTFVVEGIGTLALVVWFLTVRGFGVGEALWNSIFYSVAAFCNAGFDLSSGIAAVRPAVGDFWLNLIIIVLAQLGALSYMVWADVAQHRAWRPLALDTKIVLSLNALLLGAGTIVFLGAEWGGAIANLGFGDKILASIFQSVSARSAGFNTVDWSLVNPLTLFFWLGLMFVGGASGSTSGGIRLSTAGVVLAAVFSTLRGNTETQLWGRRIATPIVFRAVTVIVIFLLIFGLGVISLSIIEHHLNRRETSMLALMFEAMSALATVGLSTGITPALSAAGKLVLCILMFVGHLGPLITVYALQRRQRPERYRFPEEGVRIG